MESNRKPHPNNSTSRAIQLLQGLAIHVMITGKWGNAAIIATAQKAIELAEEDAKHVGDSPDAMKRVLAAKQAALALLGPCSGPEPSGSQQMFDCLVEDIVGGPRPVDLGGPKLSNQKTTKERWLRVAAAVIWQERRDLRGQLTIDAKALLGIKDRKHLAQLVSNMRGGQAQGMLEHEGPVKALFDTGWTSLKDFC